VQQANIKQFVILNYPLSSVGTKHPVDVTSPHTARSCRPMLHLWDIITHRHTCPVA